MWATSSFKRRTRRPSAAERGSTAVEFAFTALIFLTLVFGAMELARLMFVYSTLQEVTRRAAVAAVKVFPNDGPALAKVKTDAVFGTSTGELPLGPPVTNNHVRI